MREGLTKNPSRKCHRIHLWWTQTTLFWLGKKHVFCKAIFRDWETLTFHTGWNTFDIVATVTEERLCGRNNTIFTCAVLSRCPRNRCSCNDLSMTQGMKRKWIWGKFPAQHSMNVEGGLAWQQILLLRASEIRYVSSILPVTKLILPLSSKDSVVVALGR